MDSKCHDKDSKYLIPQIRFFFLGCCCTKLWITLHICVILHNIFINRL